MKQEQIFSFRATQATWEQVVSVLSPFTNAVKGGVEAGSLPVATCHGVESRRWVRCDWAEKLNVYNDTGEGWDEYVLLSEEGTQEVEFISLRSRSVIRARCTDGGWEVTLTIPRTGDVKDHCKGDSSPYYGPYARAFAGVFGFPAVPTVPAPKRVRKELPAGTLLGE